MERLYVYCNSLSYYIHNIDISLYIYIFISYAVNSVGDDESLMCAAFMHFLATFLPACVVWQMPLSDRHAICLI